MVNFERLRGTLPARTLQRFLERSALSRQPQCTIEPCVTNLREVSQIDLTVAITDRVERDEGASESWERVVNFIPPNTGGINHGDRRAIYSLVRYLRPSKILEIGTHVGASTTVIAQAMQRNKAEGSSGCLTTVDIRDVNCCTDKPWLKFRCEFSPREILQQLKMESLVNFVTDSSIDFLSKTSDRYDLIFLDGDHAAATVYREVPLALRCLRPSGVILLHDYFPKCQPLWRDGVAIPGPFLAVNRLQREGFSIYPEPLGNLPWPTKQGSTATSLALILRAPAA